MTQYTKKKSESAELRKMELAVASGNLQRRSCLHSLHSFLVRSFLGAIFPKEVVRRFRRF